MRQYEGGFARESDVGAAYCRRGPAKGSYAVGAISKKRSCIGFSFFPYSATYLYRSKGGAALLYLYRSKGGAALLTPCA
jgi:hypothetical protein